VPLLPFTPLLAIATMLVLTVFLFGHYPSSLIATGVWILVGLGVYYGYSRKREAAFEERKEWMERIERKEYRVLVAVSSGRTLESLLEAGIAIAKGHDGELIVATVAEAPEGERLMAGRRLVRHAEPLLKRAVAYARERGMAAYPVVKIARRVSQGLMETAREEQCNVLIIGQPKSHSLLERLFASTVERVFRDAPCQVGVVYGTIHPAEVRRIVVPVTGSQNSRLAAALAPAFARQFDAAAHALTVIRRGTPQEEAERLEVEARESVEAAGLGARLETLLRRDITRGIAGAMEKGDLVLVGAPSMDPVLAILGGTVPAAIIKRGATPVVVVRDVAEQRANRFERVFFRRK
jgi:nucleotide-binding universal stress UspA family protein